MDSVKLGKSGPLVSEVGLGCMGMSPGIYGPADDAESIATIRAAIDSGITLLDTGDFYGMGHNEMLIRRALDGVPRSNVLISVKFGALRDPAGRWGGKRRKAPSRQEFPSILAAALRDGLHRRISSGARRPERAD
jgi:aryl-alcohol dehydrogenase-like predicted oxidoreductase